MPLHAAVVRGNVEEVRTEAVRTEAGNAMAQQG